MTDAQRFYARYEDINSLTGNYGLGDGSTARQMVIGFDSAYMRDGTVYNEYEFGGFLILNGVKTFVDGRNDQIYTGGFLTRLVGALNAAGDAALQRAGRARGRRPGTGFRAPAPAGRG